MKNIFINVFLFTESINEWEHLPSIIRTSVPFIQLCFYHNMLPAKGNPDVVLPLVLPEFCSVWQSQAQVYGLFYAASVPSLAGSGSQALFALRANAQGFAWLQNETHIVLSFYAF